MQQSPFTSKFLLSDEEIRALGLPEHQIEEYRRLHFRKAFAVPTWVDALGPATFRTVSLPLAHAEARAVYNAHFKRADAADAAAMDSLRAKIAAALETHFAGCGAFVKLSTRSPKDVPFDVLQPGDDAELDAAVNRELDATENAADPNEQLRAFGIAAARWMRVTSAEKALRLLVLSDRVSQDLAKALEFPPSLFDEAVVLREWDASVPGNPGGEFRGFVHNNCLNALTQYATPIYFPEVAAHAEEIGARVRDFFERSVAPVIPHGSYVVDFILVPGGAIRVIELNPFYVGAGAGHFSWRTDRELFFNGPFELRVTTEPWPDALDVLMPAWRRHIQARSESRMRSNWCVVN